MRFSIKKYEPRQAEFFITRVMEMMPLLTTNRKNESSRQMLRRAASGPPEGGKVPLGKQDLV